MANTTVSKILGIAITAICIASTPVFSADWPNFHGPDRTNKSRETGLLRQWSTGGPRLLWTASGIGKGYSGATTSDGIVYTAGAVDNIQYVFAFDAGNGRQLWRTQAGRGWEGWDGRSRAYEGSRGTPTVDPAGNTVYYLSDIGYLIALDAKTGARKWSVDIAKKYDADVPKYAYSESPFIRGDRLYVSPYGRKASVVSLDKRTGNEIWASPAFNTGNRTGDAGYTSFVFAENSGFGQIMSHSSGFVYGMDAQTGRMLWSVPWKNRMEDNCTDVTFHDGYVFTSGGYGEGSMLVKLSRDGNGVKAEEVYRTKLMDNHHGGVILHNGYIYGSGHNSRGWFCLDFRTGRQMWNAPGKGSITFADGMLYFYDEEGTMSLVRAQPDRFELVSSFEVPEGGRGAYWAHPVVSNGVLYLRHANNLYAYDIKNR
ncbi:MAG: PQQ-binding-like beta-propeller repeat protein [Chitinispirillales bacterium]|jgi:outer membrane protein assembly factor BamB|nr:PQQ-binding-like beta-propeller repeat protein [Chitinispirillales bacterium]